MRLINTSIYPDDEVKELVKFGCRKLDDHWTEIHIMDANNFMWRGFCYPTRIFQGFDRYAVYPSSRSMIRIWIGSKKCFPYLNHSYPGRKTFPKYDIYNWKEAIVHLVAHEIKHIQQYRMNHRFSEKKADLWANMILDEYRIYNGKEL